MAPFFVVVSIISCLAASLSSPAEGSEIILTRPTFGKSPAPFRIDVESEVIHDIRQRVANAKAPVALLDQPDDGPSVQNFTAIQNFWVHHYDWLSVQRSINHRFRQFTTTVQNENSNFTEPVPLHFVHHVSPRPDAIPMLFIHGWPGSFLEVGPIIDLLTNPPNDTLPAFHVVAPSIPGFGFSPAPTRQGFGPAAAGHAFHSLMVQLKYEKYVINAGDLGAFILRYQAASYPSNVVSTICNFWVIEPNATDWARFASGQTTDDESYYMQSIHTYETQLSGYRFTYQSLPLSIAYAMTDSPLGFAMWIYNLMDRAIDHSLHTWSFEEIITWALMYLIQGPYGGFRFYKESAADGALAEFGFGTMPFVKQPTAISLFPFDIWYRLPLDWAQRQGNVKARYLHDRGGHFAAYEVPELFASDIWAFFGNVSLSGTGVFQPR